MDSTTAASRFPDDCLPPEQEYESRESLYAAINAWAAPRGYAFVTERSKKTSSGRRTVFFSCDRCGTPPEPSRVRERKTSTRRTECQFSVLAKESLDKTTWQVRHRPGSEHAYHNHEPSLDVTAHPVHRQLSLADRSTISNLADAGVLPKQIISYLRQNFDSCATQKDVYNCIAQNRRDKLKGQSASQALVNELEAQGFLNRIRLDGENGVTAMMAYPDWSNDEDERVDRQVAAEGNRLANRLRGTGEIWKNAEQDDTRQQALYSTNKRARH